MIAILGGLGAAVAWAVSTTCSSRSSRLLPPKTVVAWVMLFGLVITAPIALVEGVPKGLDAGSGSWLLVAGAGNVAGLMLTYAALRIGQLALVAPLVSTEGAIAALIALLAGEPLGATVAFTLALIAAGIGLSSIPPDEHMTITGVRHLETVMLAISASFAFGASLYATGRASALLPAAWIVLAARLIGALALALPLALGQRMEITRRALPLLLGLGDRRGGRLLLLHCRRQARHRGRRGSVLAVRLALGPGRLRVVRRTAEAHPADRRRHGHRGRGGAERAAGLTHHRRVPTPRVGTITAADRRPGIDSGARTVA